MHVDVPLKTTCLFLDVDGSLIDIAPRPNEVVVPQSLGVHLTIVSRILDGALALVSGRSIAQLDQLFAPHRFKASGVHGAEWRREAGGAVESTVGGGLPRRVWDDIGEVVLAFPGTFAEDKTFSFAIHYRAVPAVAGDLEAMLMRLVSRYADAQLRLLPGHSVFEIKGADFDKGVAVRRFLRDKPFAGRRPIFVGDDVTDYPGFVAATEAGGQALAVGSDIPGTSGTFASPSAVREWLAGVAEKEHVDA